MPERAKQTGGTRDKQGRANPVREAGGPQAEMEDVLALQRAISDPARAAPGDILRLQRKAGNQAVSRLIQAKAPGVQGLAVGPADDSYEQEADRVANQVLSMQAHVAQPTAGGRAQRQIDEEEIQTKPLASGITRIVQRLVQRQMDEEEIQTKALLQRQIDEEEIQTKPLLQRQIEEEEVQTKPLVQRQVEEEEIQTKPLLQRQIEEEEVQTKPLLQRQIEEEEVQTKPLGYRGSSLLQRKAEIIQRGKKGGGGGGKGPTYKERMAAREASKAKAEAAKKPAREAKKAEAEVSATKKRAADEAKAGRQRALITKNDGAINDSIRRVRSARAAGHPTFNAGTNPGGPTIPGGTENAIAIDRGVDRDHFSIQDVITRPLDTSFSGLVKVRVSDGDNADILIHLR